MDTQASVNSLPAKPMTSLSFTSPTTNELPERIAHTRNPKDPTPQEPDSLSRKHSKPTSPPRKTARRVSRLTSSYDVHFGAGSANSLDVSSRFREDVEQLKEMCRTNDERLWCEMQVASDSADRMATYLKHSSYKDAPIHGVQRVNSSSEVLSLSLLASEIVDLLQDDCSKATATLVPLGMEQFKVVHNGITVLFRRPLPQPPGSGASKSSLRTKPVLGASLLDKTLDILTRSATLRDVKRTTNGESRAKKGRVKRHWNDKLTWRVANMLVPIYSAADLAADLEVSRDHLPPGAPDKDSCDALFLILEEWMSCENSQDICPRLLDLLVAFKPVQAQLEQMFETWQSESEFLPSIVSDNMITEVARQIGDRWRSVAFELNLGRAEVLTMKPAPLDDNETSLEELDVQYARGMLLYWRQTSGRYATRCVLAHALSNCNLSFALEVAHQRSSLPVSERSQLLSLVQDIMKTRAEGPLSPVQPSASDHRRKRLAKKRLLSSSILPSASSQDSNPPTLPKDKAMSPSPWEATSTVKSGPYFGVDLEELPGRSDESIIPLYVDKCIAFIEERGMTSQGIYRVSGITSAISDLEQRYTNDHDLNLFDLQKEKPERYDENCVASSLKSFLRKLPEPLVPEAITAKLAELPTLDQDTESIVDRLKLIVVFGMAARSRALLQEVCLHLKRVSEHASENLMKSSNLAVVFWPTLLRPNLQGDDMVLMRDLPRLLQHVMGMLIDYSEQIFVDNQPW